MHFLKKSNSSLQLSTLQIDSEDKCISEINVTVMPSVRNYKVNVIIYNQESERKDIEFRGWLVVCLYTAGIRVATLIDSKFKLLMKRVGTRLLLSISACVGSAAFNE